MLSAIITSILFLFGGHSHNKMLSILWIWAMHMPALMVCMLFPSVFTTRDILKSINTSIIRKIGLIILTYIIIYVSFIIFLGCTWYLAGGDGMFETEATVLVPFMFSMFLLFSTGGGIILSIMEKFFPKITLLTNKVVPIFVIVFLFTILYMPIIFTVSTITKNSTLCSLTFNKNQCMTELSIKNSNIDYCPPISRNYCFLNMALQTKDINFCQKMPSSYGEKDCYIKIICPKGNQNSCSWQDNARIKSLLETNLDKNSEIILKEYSY